MSFSLLLYHVTLRYHANIIHGIILCYLSLRESEYIMYAYAINQPTNYSYQAVYHALYGSNTPSIVSYIIVSMIKKYAALQEGLVANN